MNIKNLFTEERAVSPVIGVILMVAITVILAAVIGAFVIGIGDDQEVTPTASFDIDFETDKITVSHSTGDTIEQADDLEIIIGGTRGDWLGHTDESSANSSSSLDSVSAGSTAEIYPDANSTAYAVNQGVYSANDSDGSTVDTVTYDSTITVDGISDDAEFDYNGETVSIVWTSETGDSSSTLTSQDAPN